MDDLTVLEIFNLLTVGITSYNIKQHVPSDVPAHNQFIPANLESHNWLDKINLWTTNQKMMINEKRQRTLYLTLQISTNSQLGCSLTKKMWRCWKVKNTISDYLKWDLEQSAVVWHSSLTEENCADLERVQKSALKVILGANYIGYKKALIKLDLKSLE